jgi:hypothetical protein
MKNAIALIPTLSALVVGLPSRTLTPRIRDENRNRGIGLFIFFVGCSDSYGSVLSRSQRRREGKSRTRQEELSSPNPIDFTTLWC